ncbi:MAG TPA: methionine biosynthesis protein MetW [Candidatus Brocadiia bacterium]|nr:methionine biosynthesis protein MetW [Candidatus Brocadiia bacterium]
MVHWLYRKLVPEAWKTSRVVSAFKRLYYRLAPHDMTYDDRFYAEVAGPAGERAAPVMASSLRRAFNPSSVLDVGCGAGALLDGLRALGVRVTGLEKARSAIAACERRGLSAIRFDVTRDCLPPGCKADVCCCFEVAEHVPARHAPRLVALLAEASPVVVFSAAPPGQGGTDHVNERPAEYWADLFRAHGFAPDASMTRELRDEWASSGVVAAWYWRSVVVFRRACGPAGGKAP